MFTSHNSSQNVLPRYLVRPSPPHFNAPRTPSPEMSAGLPRATMGLLSMDDEIYHPGLAPPPLPPSQRAIERRLSSSPPSPLSALPTTARWVSTPATGLTAPIFSVSPPETRFPTRGVTPHGVPFDAPSAPINTPGHRRFASHPSASFKVTAPTAAGPMVILAPSPPSGRNTPMLRLHNELGKRRLSHDAQYRQAGNQWEAFIFISGELYGHGIGTTKKAGEQVAAEQALARLGVPFVLS
ncbi:hypothetical protein BKA62DRAFT_480261 [Auriculariales sp. MPI-PUGE-AT-0066]|nr:hypothetical protein BKA62DRAFT_480261 [Auriculariales sp. MPI-PUGE-AT-0066]